MSHHGLALQMRFKLRRLVHEKGFTPEPFPVPLSPPIDHDVVLEGIAAATSIDDDRMRFAPFAFGRLTKEVPLLLKHDPNSPCGTINDLRYDERGQLLIRCTVSHPIAKRCGAFSIGARVLAYAMRDEDTDSFHAVISAATLDEISLTDRPSNRHALVHHRYRVSPHVEFYELLGKQVRILQRIVTKMETNHAV